MTPEQAKAIAGLRKTAKEIGLAATEEPTPEATDRIACAIYETGAVLAEGLASLEVKLAQMRDKIPQG